MNILSLDLENCYGIKKLNKTMSFKKNKTGCLIYASNGLMKTSLTKVFKQISAGKKPKDEVFGGKTKFDINIDGNPIEPDQIFVIDSFSDEYQSPNSEKLMASKKIKENYDVVLREVQDYKNAFINALRVYVGNDIDIENEITNAFNRTRIDFFDLLIDLFDNNVLDEDVSKYDFINISYTGVFNESVKKFFSTPKNIEMLKNYIECYDKLVENTTYLKKGIFSHYNAAIVSDSLEKNHFFDASNEIFLKGQKNSINSSKEFQQLLYQEKEKVLSNVELKAAFDKIDVELGKKTLIEFRSILENNQDLLIDLADYDNFIKRTWYQFLQDCKQQFIALCKCYRSSIDKVKEIKEEAVKERTNWVKTLEIFNKRFSLPVLIDIPNKEDVILTQAPPEFVFYFYDIYDDKRKEEMTRKKLEGVLSQGEKRALYLLNIINDLEALKIEVENSKRDKVVVIDDIAESFDYRNKYAIIEYLLEKTECKYLHLIILTHNFDFYRTIAKRAGSNLNMFMASKSKIGIELGNPQYLYKDPFTLIEQEALDNELNAILTLIPFARNVIEITHGTSNDTYNTLTSLLHLKDDTYNIKFSKLQDIYNYVFKRKLEEMTSVEGQEFNFQEILNKNVVEELYKSADLFDSKKEESFDIKDKIVLSIAIRLKTEEYVINKINTYIGDNIKVEEIRNKETNQTGLLINEFKKDFPDEIDTIKMLSEVGLMTSENIHINSFMFEPIIDMSTIELINLYKSVKSVFTIPD